MLPLRENKVDYECTPTSCIGRGDVAYFFPESFKGTKLSGSTSESMLQQCFAIHNAV